MVQLTAAETEKTWRELAAWVRWLVVRYQVSIQEIPPCWFRHGGMVEELTALRGAHEVSFHDSQAASAASDWHRVLWETRIRLQARAATTNCNPKDHRPGQVQAWADVDGAGSWQAEFATYVESEVAAIAEFEDGFDA